MLNYPVPTDEEIARIERETEARDKIEPRVQYVRYNAPNGYLHLVLTSGAQVFFSARTVAGLEKANDVELKSIEIVGAGSALHWDLIDVQMTTIALLQIVFQLRAGQQGE